MPPLLAPPILRHSNGQGARYTCLSYPQDVFFVPRTPQRWDWLVRSADEHVISMSAKERMRKADVLGERHGTACTTNTRALIES